MIERVPEQIGQDEKFSEKSSDTEPSVALDEPVGGMQPVLVPTLTRGRAGRSPMPTVLSGLRRDVFYVRVPKLPADRERAAERSMERKTISWMWRTRRINAPVYVGLAEWVAMGPDPLALYGPVTGAAALLWWRYNWRHQGVRVDISPVQGFRSRVATWHQARRFVKRWPYTCRDLDTVGMKVARMTYTEWTVEVDIRTTIKHGVREVRALLPALERALDARRESTRVMSVPGDERARSLRLLFIRKDPHAHSIAPPEVSALTLKSPLIPVGVFESGAHVMVDISQHLMIAGRSGSGKSVIVQILMRALTRVPWVSVVCLDMGAGATELGPWADKVEVVGSSVEDAQVILPAIIDELTRRGDLMSERGWKTWRATPEEPYIAIIIDEIQVLTENGYEQAIITLAKLLRKYGGFLVLATQYPTKDALPPAVKQQLQQTIGLRVKNETADRVMFGDSAKADGWVASKLPKHRFYIESDTYTEPMIAKGFFLSEEANEEAVRTSPAAVRLGRDCDLRKELDRPVVIEPEPVAERPAVDRKASNRSSVLMALGAEDTHRKLIEKATGFNQTTVDRHLADLVDMGKAEKVGGGVYRRLR